MQTQDASHVVPHNSDSTVLAACILHFDEKPYLKAAPAYARRYDYSTVQVRCATRLEGKSQASLEISVVVTSGFSKKAFGKQSNSEKFY